MYKGNHAQIMASVSGLRGIIGESILPDIYIRYILAYGSEIQGGTVVVGSDTRVSAEYIRNLVYSGLLATGCSIIDIGIVPTPTVGIMVKELNARGGISISASHNPVQWNAVKFFSEEGKIISKNRFDIISQRVKDKNFQLVTYEKLGKVQKKQQACQVHIAHILHNIDLPRVQRKNYRVVADLCNGAACFIAPDLFKSLNCDAWYCYDTPTGIFEREAEPLSENLGRLCSLVKTHNADIGFAFDPDADRLAIVDEKGTCIGEERSTILASYHVLKNKELTPIVVNLSTSMAIEDVASNFSVSVYRTPIGEANVITGMEKHKSCMGGEGNGGVIYAPMHFGRDAASGIALMLECMALENKSISEINSLIPSYPFKKEQIAFDPDKFPELVKNILSEIPENKLNLEDGVKISFSKGWIHLRPSATEPIIRMYCEAKDELSLDEYRNFLYDFLSL